MNWLFVILVSTTALDIALKLIHRVTLVYTLGNHHGHPALLVIVQVLYSRLYISILKITKGNAIDFFYRRGTFRWEVNFIHLLAMESQHLTDGVSSFLFG